MKQLIESLLEDEPEIQSDPQALPSLMQINASKESNLIALNQ